MDDYQTKADEIMELSVPEYCIKKYPVRGACTRQTNGSAGKTRWVALAKRDTSLLLAQDQQGKRTLLGHRDDP